MNHKRHGFTLVELLIVIVLIAILAAIATVAFGGIQQRAVASAAAGTANQIAKGLEAYYAAEGYYPLMKESSQMMEGCIGKVEDYPADSDFAEGECSPGLYTNEITPVNETFSAELSKMTSIPNTRLPTVDYPWGDGLKTRGIYFMADVHPSGGQWIYMQYGVKGRQVCMNGGDGSYDGASNVTVCSVYLYAHM